MSDLERSPTIVAGRVPLAGMLQDLRSVVVPIVVCNAAEAACLVPARAARVDPLTALRAIT
jgi:hypothetical protein